MNGYDQIGDGVKNDRVMKVLGQSKNEGEEQA